LAQLERIPATGDITRWQGITIEVVDMDGRRIDKVLIRKE
jgi:putative hemolysin